MQFDLEKLKDFDRLYRGEKCGSQENIQRHMSGNDVMAICSCSSVV